jgi:uncharacterized protein YndB with AHSA1/START domain
VFTAENVVTIDRPIDDVFAFVANPHNIPRWRTNAIEAIDVELPLRAGSSYTLVESMMGRKRFGQRVVEYDPPHGIVIETTSGALRPVQHFTFAPAPGGGTTYTARLEVRGYGVMRLFEPLLRGMVRKGMRTYGENLKRALEA